MLKAKKKSSIKPSQWLKNLEHKVVPNLSIPKSLKYGLELNWRQTTYIKLSSVILYVIYHMSYMSHMMCYTCMSFVWMRIVRCVPQTARDVGDWCCLSWSENVINIMILSTKSLNSHHLKVANIQFSSTSLQPHRNRNFSGRIPSRDSRRWNWKFRKNIIEIRMTNYCYIQVIVFDFSYLPVAAVGT